MKCCKKSGINMSYIQYEGQEYRDLYRIKLCKEEITQLQTVFVHYLPSFWVTVGLLLRVFFVSVVEQDHNQLWLFSCGTFGHRMTCKLHTTNIIDLIAWNIYRTKVYHWTVPFHLASPCVWINFDLCRRSRSQQATIHF